MSVHPQVQELLDQFAALGLSELSALPVDQVRALVDSLGAERAGDAPPLAEVRDVAIPGPAGDIPARLYRPANAAPGVVVYFHGGGWTIGSVEGYDTTLRYLAEATGVAFLSVGYRLGPEDPYPAAVDDAWAATQWVAGNGDALGVDASRLAVAGDSAGGNLAAVVSLMARDGGGPAIRMQGLIYPAVDARLGYPSIEQNGAGYFLTKNDMVWFYGHYGIGTTGSVDDWRVSPLLAASHAGLPSAIVITAQYDPLRDEGTAYAKALRDAGVDVTLQQFDGMIHGFFGMRGVIDASEDAQKLVGSALRQALV